MKLSDTAEKGAWLGVVLAVASAVFGVAGSYGWDATAAWRAFVSALAIVVTLIAATGPRRLKTNSPVIRSLALPFCQFRRVNPIAESS